ncbi:hypothetical protein OHJ16_15025, partial [Actinomyces israelii]
YPGIAHTSEAPADRGGFSLLRTVSRTTTAGINHKPATMTCLWYWSQSTPEALRIISITEITAANIDEPKNVPTVMAVSLPAPSLLPRLLSPGRRLITTSV